MEPQVVDDFMFGAGEGMVNPLTRQPITDVQLSEVADIARKLYLKLKLVESIERTFEEEKEELQKLQMEVLPEAMEKLGLAEFKLSNGWKITIKPHYSGSIPPDEGDKADPERREGCFKWLLDNGHEAIVRTEVKVAATLGDQKLIKRVEKILAKAKIGYVRKNQVHHMTLKAFIREQCELGAPPPVELFKTFQGKKAVIEGPAKKASSVK